jgi:hypothetical protein
MSSRGCEEGDWLGPLAELLLARHLNVSIPDYGLRRELLVDEEPELWGECQRKFRCIAVVGAGASAPVLSRGEDLSNGLIHKFNIGQTAIEAEKERLERITAVDAGEFEAQLAAIGQVLGDTRRVRAAISSLYLVRHPTILAYELLAHLLKHRFIDAIINMNFDELLDQSLDDELGIGEYHRIVSDRDCVNAQSDVFAPDYLPLHIKLHGTASEPESLRFTRESYYDSPVQVATEAARLFQVPECVVLNLGFGMASFDLHRLLAIPDKLYLYNLSHDPLSRKARKAIKRECGRYGKERYGSGPKFKESAENKLKLERDPPPAVSESPEAKEKASQASDLAMDQLLEQITRRVDGLSGAAASAVALRPVTRHRAVAEMLGPTSKPGKRLIDLPHSATDHQILLEPLSRAARPENVVAGYLLRRTTLELALAMARGRGLVSIATLAVDRCGHYYDAYQRHAGKNPSSWRDLCALVGFEQNDEVPDVLQATAELRGSPSGDQSEVSLREVLLPELASKANEGHLLPDLDLEALAERVLPHIVDAPSKREQELLNAELQQLYAGTEYEIHSRDDRVCSKTFSHPSVLRTLTALDAHSFELVKSVCPNEEGEEATIEVISETGGWLLNRKPDFIAALRKARLRVIVAFLRDVESLFDTFPGIEVNYQQPWHHNRHMAIARKENLPLEAIYFARHYRTPYVTPVLVKRRIDIQLLQTAFDDRWENSIAVKNLREQTVAS